MARDQVLNRGGHGTCRLIVEPEDHDPIVRSRRVRADAPKTTGEGEHHPLLADPGGEHLRIRVARKILANPVSASIPYLSSRSASETGRPSSSLTFTAQYAAARDPPAPGARRTPPPRGCPAP